MDGAIEDLPTPPFRHPCLEKVLYLGKQATFWGEASPQKLAPQDRTFRSEEGILLDVVILVCTGSGTERGSPIRSS
jgi:hypothetical protein